jgi:aldose 1-epimerase
MAPAPSGAQHEIVLGEQRATIVEVGGGIRAYALADRDVLDPYPIEAICDGAHGAPLIPWPNRLQDGVYEFEGQRRQVDLTEPEKHNAIHGFLRWRNWEAVQREPARVVMATRLHPLPGYPHTLDVRVAYALGDGGLTVTTTIANAGDGACPIATGQHPYLSPGAGAVLDDCTVQLRAETRILTDPERQLPTGREAVAGTDFDFREPRRLGAQPVDFAFTDLDRDSDGRAWTRLTCPDGATAALWVDEAHPFVELYTGDTLAPDRRRRGLGCEPMTCAPNAFRSGEGLRRLEPGEQLVAHWGARLES